MFETETFGFAIARPVQEVYEFLLEPTNFEKWAFTGGTPMRQLNARDWSVGTTVGPRIIRFATRNRYGILDHGIMREPAERPHPVGMRVVGNGQGTTLIYTNFRRPEWDDLTWSSLKEWIVTDLYALQSLLEARGKVEPQPLARSISMPIRCPYAEVAAFLFEPRNFTKWGHIEETRMEPLGDNEWLAETSLGRRVLRFAAPNDFGVLDYTSRLTRDGAPLLIPMRLIRNDDGTELSYTYRQREGTSEAEFTSALEWISADLAGLKSLLEARQG